MSAPSKRVVVTGMGLVSPLGCTLEKAWESLSSQTSGVAPLQFLPSEPLPFRSGGEARDFEGAIGDYGPLEKPLMKAIKKSMKVMCREIAMSVAASQMALSHSELSDDRDPERCGCLFGCDYILTRPEEYSDGYRNCMDKSEGKLSTADWPTLGLSKVNPLWLLKYLPNMPNSHVSIYNDFRGPNNALTVREASMGLSIAEANNIIQRGAADVMLVGATGSRIHPMRSPQAVLIEDLAAERENPAEMSRPFDNDCTGMVVGEGAGAIVLESLEHAEARGARIWGEVLGTGAAMAPADEAGRPKLEQALTHILKTTKANSPMPAEWHVHAQGTSVSWADKAEAKAIANAIVGEDSVSVTAAKSYFGNLGAGGSAVELICSLLAMEHKQLFPILNLENPIPEATWAGGPNSAGDAVVQTSFTLQGQTTCVALGSSAFAGR